VRQRGRDPGCGRHREGAAHARDDEHRDTGLPAGEHLLAAAAEHERVAALEPDHSFAGSGVLNQRTVDLGLRHRVLGGLADVDHLDVGIEVVEHPPRGEPVDHDHVRLPDRRQP
jgi:hypothetical protein